MPGMSMVKTYQRIEELRHAFEKLELNCGGVALQATFSAGIAIYPEHAVTGDELLHLADQALYQAKTAGRNCVKVYESPYPFTFTRYPKTENLVKVKELTFLK
jgi:diguanylate cyclase (GGDEF)-like protein